MVLKVHKVPRVLKEIMVQVEVVVHKVPKELKELKETKEVMVLQVQVEHLV